MSRFRFEDKLPSIYVQESRDFQLLCHIADIYMGGCINKAFSMHYQFDLDNCDENLLWAIANKQGFTTSMYFPPDVLRNVCRVFPYCISRKGTRDAIEVASLAVLSVDRLLTSINVSTVTVDSADALLGQSTNSFVVYIESESPGVYESPYLKYLDELLSFLVPAGWGVSYSLFSATTHNNRLNLYNKIKSSIVATVTGVITKKTPLEYKTSEESEVLTPVGSYQKTYSRIGMVKIITQRSTEALKDNNKHWSHSINDGAVSGGSPLIDDDGVIHIYGYNTEPAPTSEENNG